MCAGGDSESLKSCTCEELDLGNEEAGATSLWLSLAEARLSEGWARRWIMIGCWNGLLVLLWETHSWMYCVSRISLPRLDHPAHAPEVYPFGYNRIHFGPSSSNSNPLQNLEIKNKNDETIAAQCTAEANPQRVHAAQMYDDVPPIEANLGPLEAEFKLPLNETNAPIGAQFTALANSESVNATQKDYDVPPIEANLAPLEAEFKLPPKEILDDKTKAPIPAQFSEFTAQANSERVHAAQRDDDVPPIEANLAPLKAESQLPRKEGEMQQPPDRVKVFLNGASPNVSVNQYCEGAKDGEAEHSRKGNSDDKSNEFSTVGTEDNVPGVSNDLLQKEVVVLRISGHEKDQRLRIKTTLLRLRICFLLSWKTKRLRRSKKKKSKRRKPKRSKLSMVMREGRRKKRRRKERHRQLKRVDLIPNGHR
ncbi:hypothetical protein M0R45_013291 [Rubus argutus]|uniref:Uncharacterized protein n=1 Tax=Rubus argutus TaxID=59490 RepID=A0AAW1XKP5_RUBAR